MLLHVLTALAMMMMVSHDEQQRSPAETWAAIVADWEAFERAEDPITAGTEGDRDALTRLPDITPEGDARRLALLRTFEARLAALEPKRLPEADAFNHLFLSRLINERIEAAAFDPARMAFTSEGGQGAELGYLARTTLVKSEADAEAWLSRLAAAPKLIRDSIANARRGLATGFTQPRSVVDSAIVLARADAALTPDADPLLIPVAAQSEALTRARALVTGPIAEARREWLTFLESEYLPRVRAGLGLGSIPGGRPYYEFLVRAYTTTSMTPDDVHDAGLAEVARIRAEMQQVMKDADFQGGFARRWKRA